MLEALVNGVKGGKWFSLMDKVYASRNLDAAWQSVRKNKGAAGVDCVTVDRFDGHAQKYLDNLASELREGSYRPRPVKRVTIPKPGTVEGRHLGIPTVRDRVAQAAVRNVIEPIFEHLFYEHSYGFRKGRGAKDALRRVGRLIEQGYTWVVDADIQAYFDTIDHDLLMAEVEKHISDGRVLTLVRALVEQSVLDDEVRLWTPLRGTPQGAVLSPLLANIHLHPVDEGLAQRGLEVVRYADDLVILCKNQKEAEEALTLLRDLLEARKLTLHPDKTKLVELTTDPEGFEFLGYLFRKRYRGPRKKSQKRMKDKVRRLTRRANGHSLRAIIDRLNPVLRGWFEYFKHSGKTAFPPLDGWIRMRLRSILRHNLKKRGRGRGSDHQRWPNAYFAEHGVFSLVAARADAIQSLRS